MQRTVRQDPLAQDLLYELTLSHLIIRAMLNQMTLSQKIEFSQTDFGGEGATRAHERDKLIQRARRYLEMTQCQAHGNTTCY